MSCLRKRPREQFGGMKEVRGETALGRGGFGGFQRNEMVWHVRVILVQFARALGLLVLLRLWNCLWWHVFVFTLFFLLFSFCYRISAVHPPL